LARLQFIADCDSRRIRAVSIIVHSLLFILQYYYYYSSFGQVASAGEGSLCSPRRHCERRPHSRPCARPTVPDLATQSASAPSSSWLASELRRVCNRRGSVPDFECWSPDECDHLPVRMASKRLHPDCHEGRCQDLQPLEWTSGECPAPTPTKSYPQSNAASSSLRQFLNALSPIVHRSGGIAMRTCLLYRFYILGSLNAARSLTVLLTWCHRDRNECHLGFIG
jgi:hypothetical protein